MKRLYLLFLLLGCATAYSMEELGGRSDEIANICYQNFIKYRQELNFPTHCDDTVVGILSEFVKNITNSISRGSPLFKTILSDCLFGTNGLISFDAVNRMSPESKALVLTRLYYAILQADEQTRHYLLDYFSYCKSTIFKNDHNALHSIHTLLCDLQNMEKYKSVFAYFNDEITTVFAHQEQWNFLNSVIEKYHNYLIYFKNNINDPTIVNFYKARMIQLYCTASEKLESLMLINEALEILGKARLFNSPKSRALEKMISSIEERLKQNMVITEVNNDDHEMADQSDNESEPYVQFVNFTLQQMNFSSLPNVTPAPVIDLTEEPEDSAMEDQIEITHGPVVLDLIANNEQKTAHESEQFQDVYNRVINFIQSNEFCAAGSYLGSLAQDYVTYTAVELQEFKTMREFLFNYINLYDLPKEVSLSRQSYMVRAKNLFIQLKKNISYKFYSLCSTLMIKALYEYCPVDTLLNEKKVLAPVGNLIKIFVELIKMEKNHGNYDSAQKLFKDIFCKLAYIPNCGASNRKSRKRLEQLCELSSRECQEPLLSEFFDTVQRLIGEKDWNSLKSYMIDSSIKFNDFIQALKNSTIIDFYLTEIFKSYESVIRTLKENSFEGAALKIIKENYLFKLSRRSNFYHKLLNVLYN